MTTFKLLNTENTTLDGVNYIKTELWATGVSSLTPDKCVLYIKNSLQAVKFQCIENALDTYGYLVESITYPFSPNVISVTVDADAPTLFTQDFKIANIFYKIKDDKEKIGLTFLSDGTSLYDGATSLTFGTGFTFLNPDDRTGTICPIVAEVSTTSKFLSTNANHRIKSYDDLVERMLFQLGAPLMQAEITCAQCYDFIAQAIEFFTKYAGYTEEYVIFSSSLYQQNRGIRMDTLFNFSDTTKRNVGEINPMIDYDMEDYRKVVDVFSFEQGTNSGINTLFTLEQSMAQQMHFAYFGQNQGFDLVTWNVMKGWLELRDKVFAQTVNYNFNMRTQTLKLIPEPSINKPYYGFIGARVERPIYQLVKEIWVQRYALALVKIAIANVRNKFGSTTLFAGGSVSNSDIGTQGILEKKELEEELLSNKSGDLDPAPFFLG
jgi:hypothetical protein